MATENKYELTDIIKEYDGITLRQIRAIKDFTTCKFTDDDLFLDIKCGDLGGWVEKEENLSQDGNCWIADDAMVYNDARVYDNALVLDNAKVYNQAKIHGNAVIMSRACVRMLADIYDNALIDGNVDVCSNAKIYGDSNIHDRCRIYGNVEICGATLFKSVFVSGNAKILGDYIQLTGNSYITGNVLIERNCNKQQAYRNDKACWIKACGVEYDTGIVNTVFFIYDTYLDGDIEIHSELDYLTMQHPFRSGISLTWTRSDNKWKNQTEIYTEEEFLKSVGFDGRITKQIAEKYVEITHLLSELASLDEKN